jgi:hypothetical protein
VAAEPIFSLEEQNMPGLIEQIGHVKNGGIACIRVNGSQKRAKLGKKPALIFSVRNLYGDHLHRVPANKLDGLLKVAQTLHELEKEVVEFDLGKLRVVSGSLTNIRTSSETEEPGDEPPRRKQDDLVCLGVRPGRGKIVGYSGSIAVEAEYEDAARKMMADHPDLGFINAIQVAAAIQVFDKEYRS